MLPPGIFIMDGGPDRLCALHPSWDEDIRFFGPWEREGGMWRSASDCASSIVVVEECETTMETARRLVKDGLLGEWGAVVGGVQTGGRGQLRRPWVSLPGNLHASVLLPDPPAGGAWAEALSALLPLVVGYMACVALEELGVSPELKWPNDILQSGRKVGGMLIEERDGKVILGLGLNLAGCPAEAEMREDHSAPAGRLAIPSLPGGALTLLEALVSRGKSVYAIMLDEIPPTRFIAMIERRLAWMGRTILVREGNEAPFEATVSGLSPDGGLVVLRGEEETVLYSGSIFPLGVP
ncbi:MAG: biotin--[acetyl-CoA-carboxylase] ligase [Desulfovibrionaceae bacterium]|nr:biotin--[acetyl-CoA-carboxylase] ligase [Desulfovibrionaceae bacterium]